MLYMLGNPLWSASTTENPNTEETISLGISFILVLLMSLLFRLMKLKTVISETEIRIHFYPFVHKVWSWRDVKSVEVISYSVRESGGYGIRLWSKYGTVYNIKGKNGLFINLKNGKKYLIGTQKPNELHQALSKLSSQ